MLRLLPTLTAADADRGNVTYLRGNPSLRRTLTRLLPTLTADDTGHRKKNYAQGGTPLSMLLDGPLDPDFCEEFMGYPIGWTELGD